MSDFSCFLFRVLPNRLYNTVHCVGVWSEWDAVKVRWAGSGSWRVIGARTVEGGITFRCVVGHVAVSFFSANVAGVNVLGWTSPCHPDLLQSLQLRGSGREHGAASVCCSVSRMGGSVLCRGGCAWCSVVLCVCARSKGVIFDRTVSMVFVEHEWHGFAFARAYHLGWNGFDFTHA